jgi:uncharacterized membrane protein
MNNILLSILFIFAPFFLLYGCKKNSLLNRLGTVSLAYILGIIIGNIGWITPEMQALQSDFTSATIALALPLLLFSINLKQWSRLAYKTGLAVILGVISVLFVITLGHFIFRNFITECWQVSGLMVGVYIGGTANMAAIMKALEGDSTTFILVNAYDILISMVYFIFIVTYAQKLVNKFLIPFKPMNSHVHLSNEVDDYDGWDSYRGITSKPVLVPLLIALLLSGAVVAVALQISKIFPDEFQTAGIIMSITAISILLSFIPWVNRIQKSFQSGMYLIFIFCIVVGSMADFSMFSAQSLYLAVFITFVIFGSLTMQILFSKIFRIDTDTTLITSLAFILSAPFVPTVANAFKNKEIILSGITIGIIGYTSGNFLGISLAYILKYFSF